MKFLRHLIVLTSLFLLMGCPSKIYHIEELYFNDQFIDTVIQASKLTQDPKEKAYLTTFLDQNDTQLKHELLKNLDSINNFPKKEDIEKLDPLLNSISILNSSYPNKIPIAFVDKIADKNQEIKESFVIFTKSSLLYLLPRKKYRQAYEALSEIKKQTLLTTADKKIYSQLESYLPRTLHINKIRIHDSSIKKLITKRNKKKPSKYYSLGSKLLEGKINIPKEFNRQLTHYIKKDKSSYLNVLETIPSSSYLLNCSVNINYDAEQLETRNEITNTFYVKYEDDQDWQQISLTYEIFVQKKTYKAIVNADTYITKESRLIGRYIFETIKTFENIRIGEFINDMSNFADIMHSKEYKNYQKPNHENSKEYFIKSVLEDAAEVLSVKVLSTIDTDPDPYSAAFPLKNKTNTTQL